MIYLIGGPPRVGKTQLVNYLVRQQPMHAVSTDAIRYMLRRAVPESALNSDIFIHFRTDVLELWGRDNQKVLDEQNRQSRAIWPAVVEFMKSYNEDGIDLIVEGVAVLPDLVKGLDFNHKVIFIGNRADTHEDTIKERAAANPRDWMRDLDSETSAKAIAFFKMMSEYLQNEAQANHMSYVEVSDENFEADLERVALQLLATAHR